MLVKTKPLKKRYKKIDIYLDDIKNIYGLLKEKDHRTTIETDKYKFQDWDTFIANTSSTATLHFQTYEFQLLVHLSIEPDGTSLNMDFSQDNDTALAVFSKINEILEPLQRKINNLSFSPTTINFYRKDEKSNFWNKNKDSIFSDIISNSVTAILGFLAGVAIQYYFTLIN